MHLALDRRSTPGLVLRPGVRSDLDNLLTLERCAFAGDQLSRRSLRHFLGSPTAALLVAEQDDRLAGYALVLFTARSGVARLYSIAVAPEWAGRGVGVLLLAAAEAAARGRGYRVMRLEVDATNARAIARYRKAGYAAFTRRPGYYENGADALRFQKQLSTAISDSP
jgi:ribosomal protein S18 acetylase RimI-like enzyme